MFPEHGRASNFRAMYASSPSCSAVTQSGKPKAIVARGTKLTRTLNRTMKETVKDELTIPPQTRFLVPVELGRVQRHVSALFDRRALLLMASQVYDQTLESALLDLGLDVRGVAATENWEADVAKLRHWLRRLRELCTHPQIGQLLAKGHDKLHQPGVLKSMSEVLEVRYSPIVSLRH